ncbi:MAG: phage virion morphogenesis protein [Methylomarinum sp.]|nr:phage virion morphogenesis protein [Methylomarinum sp.]
MTGIVIELDKKSLETVLGAIDNLSTASSDLTPVWDDVGAYFGSEVEQRFQDEQAWDGIPWQQSERAKNEGGKTLVDHAHLRDSFTWNADTDGFEFGTNVIYAAIHQKGGEAGRNKSVTLPARPILPSALNNADDTEILNIVNRHLENAMRN